MIKPVFYTSHAETVIRERRLEKHWIIDAVRFPEWVTADAAGCGVKRQFHAVAAVAVAIFALSVWKLCWKSV